jgi:hypothetical protein
MQYTSGTQETNESGSDSVSELRTIHPKSSKVIKWLLGMACLRFLQALIGG